MSREVDIFLRAGFSPRYQEAKLAFPTSEIWKRFRGTGTELWLDTGSIEDAEVLWVQEFSALTTNNSLLNREIQSGRYDAEIPAMAALLGPYNLTERDWRLEFAFMLNAWHAMRLVERFEAYVSVEEHTELAEDVRGAVEYARRYYNLCPERFIVKVPFTPAGVLATRQLSREGIPINHTLGFSARQNYVVVRIARPAFVNVFLGRLNNFVSSNDLGSGVYVGEKAALASQRVVREIRMRYGAGTRQIGASLRNGKQIVDLAGLDVMTMPPTAAQEVAAGNEPADDIGDQTGGEYTAGVRKDLDARKFRLETLWDVEPELVACVDALENENLDGFSADDLVDFFDLHGCGDVLVRWSDEERSLVELQGKIPRLFNWEERLALREIGLDSLMNLAGLASFAADQRAMDDRVSEIAVAGRLYHV